MSRSGVGLRPVYLAELDRRAREGRPLGVDVLEVMAEGHLGFEGWPGRVMDRLRREVPFVIHGVALGLADAHAFDPEYLSRVAALIERFDPLVVSDHLCFASWEGASSFDLLPFPFTERTLAYVAGRVAHVQERWGRAIAIENVSSYLAFREDTLSEAQFLGELVARTGCGVLLDVNNLVVNRKNRGVDWAPYLEHIPRGAVWQLHLAGHSEADGFLLDTHIGPVPEEVWTLLAEIAPSLPELVAIVEWDQAFPPYRVLEGEASRARAVLRGAAAAPPATRRAPEVAPPPELLHASALVFEHLSSGPKIGALAGAVASGAPDPFDPALRASGTLTPAQQLLAYAAQYYGKLDEVMREAYPKLLAALGEESFVRMLAALWGNSPRFEGEISSVPAELPAAIAGAPALRGREHLVDLARLEHASWSARDLGFHRGEPGGRRWNPSLRLLDLAHDVVGTWLTGAPPGPGPLRVATWTVDGAPHARALLPGEPLGAPHPTEILPAWAAEGSWWA